MFNNILVANDGSDHAYKAMSVAANLASKYDAQLIILHVLMHGKVPEGFRRMAEVEHLMDPIKPQTMEVSNVPSTLAATLNNMESHITESRFYKFLGDKIVEDGRRIAADKGAKNIVTQIAIGDAASKIVQHANNEHADLIVMGTRGLGEIKGMLLGSVTNKVAQLATCPCLTVR